MPIIIKKKNKTVTANASAVRSPYQPPKPSPKCFAPDSLPFLPSPSIARTYVYVAPLPPDIPRLHPH